MIPPSLGLAEVEPCPHLGTTSRVKVITDPPKVQAWSCSLVPSPATPDTPISRGKVASDE
ncbi:MAG TPA: hypothetical protein VFO16_09485 [Pseudonocardiaceae bacterium]|nr:hypothetical protein [Pseudonocardiaceae bacterium]